MNLTTIAANVSSLDTEALILGLTEDGPTGFAAQIDQALAGAVKTALRSRTFKGKPDQVETLYPVSGLGAVDRVVLVGLGKEALGAEDWRKAVSAGLGEVQGKVGSVAIALPESLDAATAAEAGAEAAILSLYEFNPYRSEKDPDEVLLETVAFASDKPEAGPALERGADMARTITWVRDLSNRPGNMLTPPMLVEEATAMAAKEGIASKVYDAQALVREGFGLITAVGKGSEHPPAFVVLEYKGGGDAAPVVLVGKGITFDTGGVCIKPRAGMEEMKTDMHGAATVMGVLRMAAVRKLPVNLVGLLAIAENMPNGDAFKPGDVYTAYNGMTVEVVDTDAEGRLCLADGISYAVKHYEPACVIDLATLTGSIIMALGWEASGLFTNRDELCKSLMAAGEATSERLWPFPTWDAYVEQIKGDIGDWRNAGRGKGDAIHAAVLLKQFVGDVPWAHLDIAGPSWIMEPKPYRPKGSTGVGVRLLTHWLEQR